MQSYLAAHPALIAPLVALASVTPLLLAIIASKVHALRFRRQTMRTLEAGKWAAVHPPRVSAASSLEELLERAKDGRLCPSDDIYNPITQKWARASSYPVLAEALKKPHEESRFSMDRGDFLSFIGMGVAVFIVITILAVRDDLRRRHSRPGYDPHVPTKLLEKTARIYLPSDAEVRVVREGIADSVSIYTRRADFERIPFPDRPDVMRSIASSWCKTEGSPWVTTVEIRDIKTGRTMHSVRCGS